MKSEAKESVLAKLQKLYDEAEQVDKQVFAEMRTNILLVASEHYSKQRLKLYERYRTSKDISEQQKIRLTQNHTYKIMRMQSNSTISYCPNVKAFPQNEKSLQDQKAAEMHNKVKRYIEDKHRFGEKRRDFADDFNVIGEVGCLITWDPAKGKQIGWEPILDKEGNPELEENGEQKASDKPVMSGDWSFERFFGFNMLRNPQAKSMEESTEIHIRTMVDIRDMKAKYRGTEKEKFFKDTEDRTFLVFDQQSGQYSKMDGKCLLVKTFFRPCYEFPNGYFYFWTEEGVIEKGELPFGEWPIAYQPFDKYQTSPRGRSQLKVLRPFQVEINRSGSKMAEHQITLGDDKIIMQQGTTLQQGPTLPGIRGVLVNGAAPDILPGRDGSQYLEYHLKQIELMYRASLVAEELEPEDTKQVDPYAMLFKSASQKKKFKPYIERFEQFQTDIWNITLSLARHYMSDAELIEAFGEEEQGNIEEFRNPKKLCYQFRLEPQSDDIETKLGKQLTMTQVLQYVGAKLSDEQIGEILSNMPYASFENSLGDLTLKKEVAENIMLALDRGEMPQVWKYDPAEYIVKKLTARTQKGDFKYLNPMIQQNYLLKIAEYETVAAAQLQALKALESEFIPTGGALIRSDMYVQDPNNPSKSKRLELPFEAMMWLVKRLEAQGSTLGSMQEMNQRNLIEISQKAPMMDAQRNGYPPMGVSQEGPIRPLSNQQPTQPAIPNSLSSYSPQGSGRV